jgi:hypothetical protein
MPQIHRLIIKFWLSLHVEYFLKKINTMKIVIDQKICESVALNFTKKAGQQPGHIFMGYGIKN